MLIITWCSWHAMDAESTSDVRPNWRRNRHTILDQVMPPTEGTAHKLDSQARSGRTRTIKQLESMRATLASHLSIVSAMHVGRGKQKQFRPFPTSTPLRHKALQLICRQNFCQSCSNLPADSLHLDCRRL